MNRQPSAPDPRPSAPTRLASSGASGSPPGTEAGLVQVALQLLPGQLLLLQLLAPQLLLQQGLLLQGRLGLALSQLQPRTQPQARLLDGSRGAGQLPSQLQQVPGGEDTEQRSDGGGGGLPSVNYNDNGGFPGSSVVKNPPANAGDTGLIPDPGRSHMPWKN